MPRLRRDLSEVPLLERLSPRQREVAALLAVGYGIGKIAKRLGIDIKTAASHQTTVRRKLEIFTGAQLTLLAIREGLISMHDEAA